MVFTLALTLAVNSRFVERFYLHSQSRYVRQVGEQLLFYLDQGMTPEYAVSILEEKEKVLITYSENFSDSELLSNDLREKFRQKGLGFEKFWLWNQDYESAMENGSKLRFYQQDRLNYGILTEYLSSDSGMFCIASIVPNTDEAVSIINQFLAILIAGSSVIAAGLMYILVRHITNPLKEMEEFSRRIASQDYGTPLVIRTKDELEVAADSMNQMSQSIQLYQKMLIEKNRQMEQLMDNVAHDLKTPISLVGLYASGIRDGLDDGTFLDTVIRQNSRMSQLVEQLLSLSRIGQKSYPHEDIYLDRLLEEQIGELRILADKRGLRITTSIAPDSVMAGNEELISTLFINLLSNSVKYGAGGSIKILLKPCDSGFQFSISNQFLTENLDMDRIWEPFYVGEASRNQALSGTGLGLPIVKRIADQCGYQASCAAKDGEICFTIIFNTIH